MKRFLLFLLPLGLLPTLVSAQFNTPYRKYVGARVQELIFDMGPPHRRTQDPDVGLIYIYEEVRVDDGGYFLDDYEPPTEITTQIFFFVEEGRVINYHTRTNTTLGSTPTNCGCPPPRQTD